MGESVDRGDHVGPADDGLRLIIEVIIDGAAHDRVGRASVEAEQGVNVLMVAEDCHLRVVDNPGDDDLAVVRVHGVECELIAHLVAVPQGNGLGDEHVGLVGAGQVDVEVLGVLVDAND